MRKKPYDSGSNTLLRAMSKLGILFFLTFSGIAWGHATGENYIWINAKANHLEGRFEVRLDDLRTKLELEIPADHDAATQSVADSAGVVQAYLDEHFKLFDGERRLVLEFGETKVLKAKRLGHFAQYFYRTPEGDTGDVLSVENRLFFEGDRFHRSLLLVEYDERIDKDYGAEFTALVFGPTNSEQTLDFGNIRGLLSVKQFVWQGMLHIWIGVDHILFLVALLLPAVLVRQENSWVPVDSFRSAFWNTVKIVTVFTIAHSITLALAALDIVQLPSRFVESVIALSIILVALNNIFPRFKDGVLLLIFVFGLFHGLGFASVMGDLPFRMQDLVWVIVAFNVGVEIGQLVIVAAFVPLIYWVRRQAFYEPGVLAFGSVVLVCIASFWLVERSLGLG